MYICFYSSLATLSKYMQQSCGTEILTYVPMGNKVTSFCKNFFFRDEEKVRQTTSG